MYKNILLLLILSSNFIFSCTNQNKEVVSEGTLGTLEHNDEQTAKSAETKEKTEALGVTLMQQSDCLACHHQNQELLGPSFRSVAQKYESSAKNISYLTEIISKGGVGVWGQVPMPAHQTLKRSDVEEMVKYILAVQ